MRETVAVYLAAFAYFWLFRGYGFQVEDEGTLLFQIVRAIEGQRPYLDFHTGYGPAFFSTASVLFELVGRSLVGFRLAMAALNAATAAGLFVLAARLAGKRLAGFAPILWVAFIPVFVGEFAAFNIPYPAWFATLAWLLVALATLLWAERGRPVLLVWAGLAAAYAFAVKLNAGAFSLAAIVWVVCMYARADTRGDRFIARCAAVIMAFGVWLAFGFPVSGVEVATLLLPAGVIAFVATGPGLGRFSTGMHPRAGEALSVLAVSFVIPTLAWTLPLVSSLGLPAFLREVLLLGSGAAELYYTGPPVPQPYALVGGLGVIALALLGRTSIARRVPVVAIFSALALVVAAAVVVLLPSALMPEGLLRATLTQLENATFWLTPLANLCGALMLLRFARGRADEAFSANLAVVAPLACAMYLQLFPRTDFMHVIMAAPISIVLATGLLARTMVWWTDARWPAGVNPRTVAERFAWACLLVIVTFEIVRSTAGLTSVVREADPPSSLPFGLAVESQAADDLIAFEKTRRFVAERTEPREEVLAFPALSGLLFAADRASPVPHDYWFPGRPDHEDESVMLAGLSADPPRYVVTLNDGWTFFTHSPVYFSATRDFVRDEYRLAARFGRYDVLQRNDLPAVLGDEGVERWQPTGPRTDAITAEVALRRQGAARWMADLKEEDVSPDALPADPRDAVLLLRAVRQSADLRAAGLILAGYEREHPRVRREAERAMNDVAAGFAASRDRWAGDFYLERLRRFVEGYADDAQRLVTDPMTAEFGRVLLDVHAGAEVGD
jgi:hypothetical protein